MKKILLTLSIAALTITGACQKSVQETQVVETMPAAVQMADAKLGAVLVYADWCGSCKILDPVIKDVRANNSFESTNFIVLDYTKKDKDAFYAAAEAAGVADAVKQHLDGKIKTGLLLLVDMDDQKVVKVVRKDMNAADISKAISQAESEA